MKRGGATLKGKIGLVASIFLFVFLSIGCSLTQEVSTEKQINGQLDKEKGKQHGEAGEKDWNQTETDTPFYDIDTLYNLTEVPQLDSLFLHSTFINQVYIHHIPYFFGYSEDGHYAAFILYDNTPHSGYEIVIYDTFIGEKIYSIFIPYVDRIIESKPFFLAKEALEQGFDIHVTPKKEILRDGMEYETNQDKWYFYKEKDNQQSFFKMMKTNTKDEWLYLLHDYNDQKSYTQLFVFPGNPQWITLAQYNNQEKVDFLPIFIHLESVTNKNSIDGKEKEADKWLYGTITFLYGQEQIISNKGYIAVSNKNKEELKAPYHVGQWIYLDSSGTMKWYGNSEGIFNKEGKSIQSLDKAVYYRMNIIMHMDSSSLKYIIIDQLDKKTDELIRTYEFKWDERIKEMVPIQLMELYP